jgi:copper oxidase (laccase) domain-containing protein
MPEQFKTTEPERYAQMTERNKTSRYMTDVDRPFTVNMSVHSAGKPRVMYNVFNTPDQEIIDAGKAASRLIKFPIPGNRFPLAGNMSTLVDPKGEPYGPKDLPGEFRTEDARNNMKSYMESLDIDPAMVRVLFPDRSYDTPLQVVNIDEDPTPVYDGNEPSRLTERGDMIYTYNPNIVLGVRPADCPLVVISADTPKGRIYSMVHFAWQGAAADQVSDMKREFANLGMDLSTATVYLTPGGHAETFPYTTGLDLNEKYPVAEGLFNDPEPYEKEGKQVRDYEIDTPNFVYEGLLSIGLEPDQIFVDTSDTTAPESGYASHSRASRLDDDNSRDFVTVKLEAAPSCVASNPDRPTPPEIEWQIIPVTVEYYDFDGELQSGDIEVNRAVAGVQMG